MLLTMSDAGARTWSFWWESSADPVAVTDASQLAALLHEAVLLGASDRAMAELTSPEGADMAIGLGGTESVATFRESSDPPYHVSRGRGTSEGTVVFFYEGHWT